MTGGVGRDDGRPDGTGLGEFVGLPTVVGLDDGGGVAGLVGLTAVVGLAGVAGVAGEAAEPGEVVEGAAGVAASACASVRSRIWRTN